MKKIMQFRYEGPNHSNNYPKYSDYMGQLTRNNIFSNYKSISKFGIQGPPGLRFYLNNSLNPITIGKTGIYELDLENIGRINSIQFIESEVSNLINNTDNKLLIDIVYEGV